MPYKDPDTEDPMELVGVPVPVAGDGHLRTMAECFVEEYARLGFDQHRILALFRNPFYAGPHQAWQRLGDDEISKLTETYCRAFRTWR